MPALDHHMLDLIYRVSHLVGMAVLVGGAVLVAWAAIGEYGGDRGSAPDRDIEGNIAYDRLARPMSEQADGRHVFEPAHDRRSAIISTAARYEKLFWAVLAIQVLTGIGSVGLIGGSVPAPESRWGGFFAIKLSVVLVLALLSVLRSSMVAGFLDSPGSTLPRRARNLIVGVYGGTALALVSIVIAAVRLTRG